MITSRAAGTHGVPISIAARFDFPRVELARPARPRPREIDYARQSDVTSRGRPAHARRVFSIEDTDLAVPAKVTRDTSLVVEALSGSEPLHEPCNGGLASYDAVHAATTQFVQAERPGHYGPGLRITAYESAAHLYR
jgi:hypothetical protein